MTDESNGESTFEFVDKKTDESSISEGIGKTGEKKSNMKRKHTFLRICQIFYLHREFSRTLTSSFIPFIHHQKRIYNPLHL